MAGRPQKEGLDYFELDCLLDDRIRLIQAEFGLKGFAVVVKLYQKIYGERGYYCEWNKDTLLLFMSENGVSRDSENSIQGIVDACIRRNIFSEDLYKRYGILTSHGIQKRYLRATSRRESLELKKEYLLLSEPEKTINADIKSINVSRNSINVSNNSQRREEKRREEYIRESKRFTPPSLDEVTEYCISRKNSINAQRFIDFYESKGWLVGKNTMKDWKAAVRTWETREHDTEKSKSKNKWSNDVNQRSYDFESIEKSIIDSN